MEISNKSKWNVQRQKYNTWNTTTLCFLICAWSFSSHIWIYNYFFKKLLERIFFFELLLHLCWKLINHICMLLFMDSFLVPSMCESILPSTPHSLDYCSFILRFEISKFESLTCNGVSIFITLHCLNAQMRKRIYCQT